MNAKHTPGPWVANVQRVCCSDDRDPIICEAIYRMSRDGAGETAANLALISAAPDLLAACEALLYIAQGKSGNVMYAVAQASAAIAKARGAK